MKQLFLTSSVHAVAQDIAKRVDLKQGNKLVFIDTAAEPETGSKQWLHDDRQALVDAGFQPTNYTLTGKTKDQLQKDLKDFDYIYLSGGNTLHLLHHSQKSGFIPLIRDWVNTGTKTYIGTSAGSIIAGEKCPDYLLNKNEVKLLKNKNGYALVNFTIIPHWGSPDFKSMYLDKRLEIAYKTDQVPLLLVTDTQYVHVSGNKLEIVETLRQV